jgi:phosphoglycolate phosphatase-like HAD superfamily hydrolase
MLEAVLFDYDGTIADSFQRQYEWLVWWSENGSEFVKSCDEKYHHLFDQFREFPKRLTKDINIFKKYYNETIEQKTVQGLYDELGLPCDMNDMDHPVWKAYNLFKSKHPIELFPGMKEAILEIHKLASLNSNPSRNKRIRLGINTTNSWESIYKELRSNEILHCFDCFVTKETLVAYHGNGNSKAIEKPSKISVALALHNLDSEANSTIHVGDTLSDLKSSVNISTNGSGKKANLITIGVDWGFEGSEILSRGVETPAGKREFDYIVYEPKRIVEIVKRRIR